MRGKPLALYAGATCWYNTYAQAWDATCTVRHCMCMGCHLQQNRLHGKPLALTACMPLALCATFALYAWGATFGCVGSHLRYMLYAICMGCHLLGRHLWTPLAHLHYMHGAPLATETVCTVSHAHCMPLTLCHIQYAWGATCNGNHLHCKPCALCATHAVPHTLYARSAG